jgi:exo-1,4-beta-D-glucosaminidase
LWQRPGAKQFHAGRNEFENLGLFNRALTARYGKPRGLEDYLSKAQLMGYEGERALFEAYARNKYQSSTGVVHWMLNNAWPSLIWHLYAHDLSTAGNYFGAKKANEPLHIQYSYDDRSVVVVNQTSSHIDDLHARVEVMDLTGATRFTQDALVTVEADAVTTALTIPQLDGLSRTYWVKLTLRREAEVVSENWYWLSLEDEVSDFARSDFYHAPVVKFADYRALAELKPASLRATLTRDSTDQYRVELENDSDRVAFFVKLELALEGRSLLPVLWQDNYVSLSPGQKRVLWAHNAGVQPLQNPQLHVSGWNVEPFRVDTH